MNDGTYSDRTIKVTSQYGVESNILTVSEFTIHTPPNRIFDSKLLHRCPGADLTGADLTGADLTV